MTRAAVLVLLLVTTAGAAELDPACAKHLPLGAPQVADGIKATMLCKQGYAALHDDDYLIPRYVAYVLTAAHTLGCEARKNNFHADEDLPADRRATPKDYAKSGYDKGHQAPAADFAWSKAAMADSFSMVNMAPQVPGLNRQQWERLEEYQRTVAWQRKSVLIYVGPVIAKQPKTIGAHAVAVPSKFWKVIVDTAKRDALAFVMPQKTIPKGDLAPWQVPVADVETAAAISLPLPDGIDRETESKLWPADRKGWNKAHRAACGK